MEYYPAFGEPSVDSTGFFQDPPDMLDHIARDCRSRARRDRSVNLAARRLRWADCGLRPEGRDEMSGKHRAPTRPSAVPRRQAAQRKAVASNPRLRSWLIGPSRGESDTGSAGQARRFSSTARGVARNATVVLVLVSMGAASRAFSTPPDTAVLEHQGETEPPASMTHVPEDQPQARPTRAAVAAAISGHSSPTAGSLAAGDLAAGVPVPAVLLAAYRTAASGSPASCHIPVSLLAAIGQVESGSLRGRAMDSRHRVNVLGPVLDGNGFAAIRDTDGGRWDGDTVWDRAVGPMQFIPSTWEGFARDGDGDGEANPQDVEDAAAGTAAYLCYGGRDLSTSAGVRAAVLSYNHSEAYLSLVLSWKSRFQGGVVATATGIGSGPGVAVAPPSTATTPLTSLLAVPTGHTHRGGHGGHGSSAGAARAHHSSGGGSKPSKGS